MYILKALAQTYRIRKSRVRDWEMCVLELALQVYSHLKDH